MSKKFSFKSAPAPEKAGNEMREWVEGKLKRLTIEVEPALHAKVKAKCAMRGESMTDVVRRLLEEYAR